MKVELYWIEGPWPGRLAIMPRSRGGDWLEGEIQSLKREGIQIIVSTLTEEETAELGLEKEMEICEGNGLKFISFPIPDRDVPASKKDALELIGNIEEMLTDGKKVTIHCRQGIGRSSMLAAGLFIAGGISSKEVWNRIEKARGRPVPDTANQKAWVEKITQELLAPTKK